MTRKLTSLMGNTQALDGGAMFGNAPKALWSRWCEADEQNRVKLACRALLIQEDHRTILCETGIGNFFEPKYKDRYGVIESEHVLLDSLKQHGLSHSDIDIVVLSHLHFDHAGGLLSSYEEGKEPELLFPNATFAVGEQAWERANNPHPRDRASFLPKLNALLEKSGRLHVMSGKTCPLFGEDYTFYYSSGHTPGMMHLCLQTSSGPLFFAADLIPGVPWVHVPITMGYDRYPELLIDEKKAILTELLDKKARLFFTHDHDTAAGLLCQDERGRFAVTECVNVL